MSYRLDQRDEADVRYWLGEDARGEVGVHSGSSSLDKRSIYKPIENFKPFRYVERTEWGLRWHGTEDVGLRCGPIVVTPKKPHYVERDTSAELIRVSEKDSLLKSIWDAVPPSARLTLDLCYSGSPVPHGFELFGDVAPVIYDTAGALLCVQRESHHTKETLTRLDALIRFGTRLLHRASEASDEDLDLRTEMEIEADNRLSAACRKYTAIADAAYKHSSGKEKSVA